MTVVKVCFYIAHYPVRWTAQSALHFSSPGRPVHSDTNSASLGSILAMQQLRNGYSPTCPPLSIARYSFIQLSRLRRREVNENAHISKRWQRGFEPRLSRLRVRHSTTELYHTPVRPALMYGAETWTLKKAHNNVLEVGDMRMLRWMCKVMKLDKI